MRCLRSILSLTVMLSTMAGCAAPSVPTPAPEPPGRMSSAPQATVPESLAQLRPEHVEYVRYIPPIPPGNQEPRPLYGARPEDRPWVEKLLQGLAAAQPADAQGADAEHRRVSWLELRLVDGRRILIREAWTCEPVDGGVGCTTVKGKLVVAEGDARRVVTSPALETFLHEEMGRAMPPVEKYSVEPAEPRAGGQFRVKGNGVAGATAYRLTLESGGDDRLLAEGEATFGDFTWEGTLPADLVPGEYMLNILSDAGGSFGMPVKVGPGTGPAGASEPVIAWAQVRFGLPSVSPSRPLYPGRKADAQVLKRLQEWLAKAEPNGKTVQPPGRGPYLTVKYLDGSQVTVFPAMDCVTRQVQDGTERTCGTASGEVVISRPDGSVQARAPELAAWVSQGWERDAPRVEAVRAELSPNGGYRVTGDGWAGADMVTLWAVPDGTTGTCCPPSNGVRLAVIPAILGRFAWEGKVEGSGTFSLMVTGEGHGSASVPLPPGPLG